MFLPIMKVAITGEFLRYGIGGELQNPFSAFAINYYLPITDDKHTGSTVAFSQKVL